MKIRQLIEAWEGTDGERRTAETYSLRLPISDAARIHALVALYPGRTVDQILTDLLSAALDELQEAFPYIQGQKVAALDEQGDPIYEDAGPAARFDALTKEYLRHLEEKLRD
jgi:hypothetical protein